MQFNSIDFMLFFPIVALLYFVMPKKLKTVWLLLSSYYFYMSWNADSAFLRGGTPVRTYISGLLMSGSLCPEFEGGG